MDRKNAIVTEEDDKKQEEDTIRNALKQCGYPNWTMEKVKKDMEANTAKKKSKKDCDKNKSKGMVVIPYVQGVSERLQRVFNKHNIQTAMKPTNTLKNILVHPKDKRDDQETCDCVYEVPCKNCKQVYIGETGRPFGTRLEEHKKEAEKIAEKKYTRAARKDSVDETHKSAITDHVAQQNHVIDWKSAKVIDKDSCKPTRWIREAIWIRKRGDDVINRDEGTYSLNHVFDQLLEQQPRQHRVDKTGNSSRGGVTPATARSSQN